MTVAVIAVIAVFFVGMGVYALAAPAALIRPFGVTLDSPTSRSEVRAVYGGFGLAIAAVLGYAAFRGGELQKGILITVGIALAGMALGRTASAILDERIFVLPELALLHRRGRGRGCSVRGGLTTPRQKSSKRALKKPEPCFIDLYVSK